MIINDWSGSYRITALTMHGVALVFATKVSDFVEALRSIRGLSNPDSTFFVQSLTSVFFEEILLNITGSDRRRWDESLGALDAPGHGPVNYVAICKVMSRPSSINPYCVFDIGR